MNWDHAWIFIIAITSGLWFTYLAIILANHLITIKEYKTLAEFYKWKGKESNELITQKESNDDTYSKRNLSRFNKASKTKSKE